MLLSARAVCNAFVRRHAFVNAQFRLTGIPRMGSRHDQIPRSDAHWKIFQNSDNLLSFPFADVDWSVDGTWNGST